MHDHAPPRFLLRTLGTLALERIAPADQPADAPLIGKPLAILAYLACSATRSAPRSRLGDLFWATSVPARALQSVRQALHRLHGLHLVHLVDDAVRLPPTVEVDVDAFRVHLARNELADAVALYHGDFCEKFAADGAEEFERWASAQRASLRSQCAEAACQLADAALAQLRATDALALARTLRHIDPEDERRWRIMLQALLLKEDRFGLRAAAAECGEWLTEEAREPSRSLRGVLDRATVDEAGARQTGDSAAHSPESVVAPDLVGREEAFGRVLQAWHDAEMGTSRCIVLSGDPGLGKTRLLGAVYERLTARRARIASVRALPAESAVSYALVSRLAAALAGLRGAAGLSGHHASVLVGLNPSLTAQYRSAAPASTDRLGALQLIDALDELVGAVADDARVAVLVDDLHWADAESMQVLAALAERQMGRRVLVVLARRPRTVRPVRVPSTATIIGLEPLSANGVEQLLGSIARLPDRGSATWSERLHRAAQGNPLLVLETLRLAMDADALAIDDGRWVVRSVDTLGAILAEPSALADRLARLDDAERRVALLLAVAGRPLPAAAFGASQSTRAALRRLEVRDVVVHVPEGWAIAHDALAEALLERTPPEAQRDARLQAAEALLAAGTTESRRRALELHVVDQRWDEAARVVMTSLRDPASSGGAFFNIADHALAGVASHDARTAIRARLPWRARVGMRYIATGAVVLMAALAVGGAAWFLEVPVARHEAEHFFATTDSSGTHHARAVRISPVGWTADRPLDVTTGRAIAPWPSFAASDVTMRPGSRAIVGHREYPDSGAVDVTLWMPDGREQRLTAARGDDVPSGWAPDGSALLIESSREGRRGHRAIYAIVPETGRLRRISSGGADGSSDTDASWSPDGSRIAFTRQYFALRPDELCLVDSDGRHERCRGFAGHSVVRLGGWLDARRLMITTDSVGAERVGIVHVDAWTMAWTPLVGDCRVSPDTRWVACSTGMELHIAPMSDLSATSRVIAGTPDRVVTPVWNVSSKPRLPIGSLTIVPPRSEVLVGAPTRLRAVAMTTGGQALDGITLRWSMLDSTQGQLTPEGVLTAARAGAIRIAVTAGGWRTTDTTVHAVARDGDVLLRERWEDSVSQRWRYFGVPTPTTVDVNGAKAFWNRGEGTYYSGAYLRSASPAALGIWVEARVATPLTATQWQVLSLNMVGLRDRRLLDRWDHATGYLPLRHDLCHFTYPRGEGMRNIDRFSPAGYVSEVLPYPSDSLRSGAWYTVLLQVLPDGRCGVAINGIPVHVSTTGGPVPDSAIVLTQGSSDGTRILLGPLTIGRGVRLDVPWAQAGRFGRSSMSSTNVMRGVPRGQPR